MKTFDVRTFGCQMNKHDSERIAGMLEASGYVRAEDPEAADVVVFNTCCVRERADERLRGQVASLKSAKLARGVTIAVGGCIAQRDGVRLLEQLPHVDVVFGTHNVGRLPALLAAAAESRGPVVELAESTADFTSDLPTDREHPWHAWVPIAVGCDNFCTYCIVPHVRGRERSRPLADVVAEVQRLAADGVVEVTLLGQNVNSYGRDLYGSPRFAEMLRRVAAAGVERVRFTTSHPKDLSAETIQVMATTPQVCRHLHLPVQSGSDRILASMNRHYTHESYLALVDRLYAAMPDLALSTDVIVGFPGETEDDFAATMRVVASARYDQAFTFLYSPREGTPAASMPDRVPREVAHERFDRLVAAVQSSALANNAAYVGRAERILVEGASKRDAGVLLGRTASNKVVHAPVPAGHRASQYAGTFLDVRIEEAQTWFLMGRSTGSGVEEAAAPVTRGGVGMAQDTLGIITPHPPIMVPEVGGERAGVTRASSEAMATAARLLERFDPETVVIMSPHAPTAADAFLVDTAAQVGGDLGGFAAPQMAIRAAGDPPLALAIIEEAEKRDVPVFDRAGSARLDSGELDHGVLVPMSFLDRAGRLPLVVLSLSFLPYRLHTLFGHAVAAAAEHLGRRVAFVASGDMSHRLLPGAPAGYSAEAKLFDAEVVRLLEAGDYAGLSEIDPGLVETAGECGLRSLITLGGFIEGRGLTTHLLAYEGPWGVGYLTGVVGGDDLVAGLPPAVIDTTAAGGRKGGMPGDDESEPVALARRTIDTYVRYGVDVDLPAPTDPLLSSRAGAFVSLHSTGDLRGCLGTILPTRDTLAHEIVHNAIQAATCDPRFPPISIEELDDLDISVDVLHAPEPVADLHELDPSAYGVIVTSGFRRGLLLPDLEGVVTPEQQVAISMQKAGIRPGEPIELERFKVDRYH